MFFTSGTTGLPKGVVSPHLATTRLFGAGGLAGFGRGAVICQAAPASWDAFSLEVWGALTTGGTLVLAPDEYFMPYDLTELRQAHGVNCLWLTASLFNLFVDTEPECFDGIAHIYTGGERLSAGHVRQFRQRYPAIGLYNGYGPVESCVFATVHPIDPDGGPIGTEVPIGRPVAETQVHVLTEDRPCRPGELGEIFIGGTGLAIGYLNNPELTAEKFRTITIDGVPTRLYATGDHGSLDGAGVLHFGGRADRQVKLRGHRLELAEIERAARELAEIEQCVVLPVLDQAGGVDRLLLAYSGPVPPEQDGALSAAEVSQLKQRLGQRLPDYAVPNLISWLERFPLTANGKLDSTALRGLVLGH